MSSRIVEFYRGAADDQGRLLAEIQRWPDARLEQVHDFIQWLFPLPERSPVNPEAPLIDRETRDAFAADPDLRAALHASFTRMLRFYGFEQRDGAVHRAPNFAERSVDWLHPGNHNHLRITRILKCLSLLGLKEDAAAFLAQLKQVSRDHPEAVSRVTLQFWTAAVS